MIKIYLLMLYLRRINEMSLNFLKNKVQKIHLINIKEYYRSNVMEYKKEGVYVIKILYFKNIHFKSISMVVESQNLIIIF